MGVRALAVLLALPIVLPIVLSVSARAEIVQKSDRGFVSSAEVDVAGKTPVEVWQVLIAPARWWSPLHSYSGNPANMFIDPQAGGCFCELLPKPKDTPEDLRRGSVEHMRVIAAMPPKLLRLSGALGPLQGEALVGTLTVTLKALPNEGTKGGTHLTWSYVVGGFMRMNTDEIATVVDKVMTEQFERLAQTAVTGSVVAGPVPAAEPPAGLDKDEETHR